MIPIESFFRKHTEEFLIGFAVVLALVMIGWFIWGMIFISENLDSVFMAKTPPVKTTSFNLQGAQNLDLKGLAPR